MSPMRAAIWSGGCWHITAEPGAAASVKCLPVGMLDSDGTSCRPGIS